ncbi:MAG: NPCBM/NEW2 domain-containing protein [Planctomycetota bacterium]|nr:NPCBM/NEW2 domain-containing protein [Planctomycetota bacterium]
MHITRSVFVSTLLVGAALSLAGATTQSGPRVVLDGSTGESKTLSLADFDTADPRVLGAHVVRFEGFPAVNAAVSSDTATLELKGGERLVGTVQRADDEVLSVTLATGVRARASLEDLRSITFRGRIPSTWNAPFERAKEGDRIYRRKNETIEKIDGGVEAFGETSVQFHDDRIGSLDVAWSELVALFVDSGTTQKVAVSATDVPIVVDLVGKSRLVGMLSKIDAQGVALTRKHGEALRIPADIVAQVSVDDGRVVFLSDMEPREAPPSAPFGDDLGLRWPHKIDASVMDGPLTAGGKVFARGLGVHAPSRMVWALDGTFESIRGACAIDDSVLKLPTHGSVKFRVLVDGAKRFESKIVRGGEQPVAIVLEPASLLGAKELVLEVDTAEDNFVADRADWLQVMLWRSAQAR